MQCEAQRHSTLLGLQILLSEMKFCDFSYKQCYFLHKFKSILIMWQFTFEDEISKLAIYKWDCTQRCQEVFLPAAHTFLIVAARYWNLVLLSWLRGIFCDDIGIFIVPIVFRNSLRAWCNCFVTLCNYFVVRTTQDPDQWTGSISGTSSLYNTHIYQNPLLECVNFRIELLQKSKKMNKYSQMCRVHHNNFLQD